MRCTSSYPWSHSVSWCLTEDYLTDISTGSGSALEAVRDEALYKFTSIVSTTVVVETIVVGSN